MKMPLEVEAIQLTVDNEEFAKQWSNHQVYKSNNDPNVYMVQCLEALAETPVGSYVVKGVKGEVWPVRQDIFDETYKILGVRE